MTTRDWALAGDEELVLDLDGCRVDSVMRCDDEVMLSLCGGIGWIKEGHQAEYYGTNGVGEAISCSFVFRVSSWAEGEADHVLARLEEWAADAGPVRMLCAPGKRVVVMRDFDDYVKLARLGEPSYALGQ